MEWDKQAYNEHHIIDFKTQQSMRFVTQSVAPQQNEGVTNGLRVIDYVVPWVYEV